MDLLERNNIATRCTSHGSSLSRIRDKKGSKPIFVGQGVLSKMAAKTHENHQMRTDLRVKLAVFHSPDEDHRGGRRRLT